MGESRKNVRILLAYDGRGFEGWQRHPGKPTVQGALEEALSAACEAPVEVRGSGRTDRGVHARGQVASARIPAEVEVDTLRERLTGQLRAGLEVLEVSEVPRSFHARMSATGKRYVYTIANVRTLPPGEKDRVWHVPEPLDVEAMRGALPVFVGTHDFASFASKANHARATTERTVSSFSLEHVPPHIVLTIEADGFLYKMVRNIVRAVVKVGEGRVDVQGLEQALAARDRHAAPGTAPASGLCLDAVFYPDERPDEPGSTP